MENTSYEEALDLYEKTFMKIDSISHTYPASQLAVEIAQDQVRLQNIPFSTLRTNLLPQLKTKARAEGSLGICALYLAEQIPSSDARQSTFPEISRRYLEAGLNQEALHLVDEIKDSTLRERIQSVMAEYYLGKEKYDDARKMFSQIQNPELRKSLGPRITDGLIRTGRHQEAEEMLETTNSPDEKILLLLKLARLYTQSGQQKKALALSDRAFQGIKTLGLLGRSFFGEDILSELIGIFMEKGQIDQALETISKIENPDHRMNKYSEFIEKLSAQGQEGRAKEIAGLVCQKTQSEDENINWGMLARICRRAGNPQAPLEILASLVQKTNALPPSYEKAQELVRLVIKYAEAAEFNQAQTLCDSISVPYFRALGLCEISEQLVSAGKKEEARALLNKAYPMIKGTFQSPIPLWVTSSTRTHQEISPAEVQEWWKLKQYLEEKDRDSEKKLMNRIIILFAKAEDFDQAFALIEKEIGSYGRFEIYLGMVDLCLEAGNKERAAQALSSAFRVFSSSFFSSSSNIEYPGDSPEVTKVPGMIFLIERYLSGKEVNKLVSLAEIAEDPLIKAVIWGRLAENTKDTDKTRAVEYTVQALQIVYQITAPAIQLQVLNDLARIYASIGQYDQQLRGIEIIRDDYLKIVTLLPIAEELNKSGQKDRARQLFSKAETLAGKIVNPRQKSSALAQVALRWARFGARAESLALLSQAEADAQNNQTPESAIDTLFTISEAYVEMKNREKNREILNLIFPRVGSLKDFAQIPHLEKIVDKYLETGDYEEALSFSQKITNKSSRLTIGEKIYWGLLLNGQFDQAVQIEKTLGSKFRIPNQNQNFMEKILGKKQLLREGEDICDAYPQAFNLLASSVLPSQFVPLLLVELNISAIKNKLLIGRKAKSVLHNLIQKRENRN